MTPSELAKVLEALECASSEMRDLHPEHPAHVAVDQALAILDREAGRKTRTVYRCEFKNAEGVWVRSPGPLGTRKSAEATISKWTVPGRILEVTESWEEPKP